MNDRHDATARQRREPLDLLARTHLFILALAVGIGILWLFSDVLLLLFASALLACQLRGAARGVQRRAHLPYGLALAVVVLALGGAIFALAFLRGPRLVEELYTVYDQINDQIARLWTHFGQVDWFEHLVKRVQGYVGDRGGALAGRAAGIVSGTIGNIGSLLLIVVAGIYFAVSADLYRDGFVALLPRPWRERGREVLIQEGGRCDAGSSVSSSTWRRSAS